MARLMRLYADMTFEEKNVKTQQDKIVLSRGEKDYTPTFGLGNSVFRERRKMSHLLPWKRRRNLMILVDGAIGAVNLEVKDDPDHLEESKPALHLNFGTLKDTKRFLYKVVAKSKGDQKPITNMQFMVIALLIGAVLVLQFMIMKGIKF